MKKISIVWSLFLILVLTLLAGCASSSGSNTNAALSAGNINLIFVVSPDLAYQTPGDVNPDKANLSNQGLQRSLLMATYLKTHLLGTNNVTYLLQSYGGTVQIPVLFWPHTDYDTIWTVKLDAQGNLTVNNALCEGIESATLPKTAPQF